MPLPDIFRGFSLPAIRLPALRSRRAVIYEVDLRIDGETIGDFDAWLKEHMREMLAFPGFQEAEAHMPETSGDSGLDDAGRHRRVVTYLVRTRRELDSYLHTHAARMRAAGKERFGKALAASRRILPQDQYALPDGLQLLYSSEDISGGLPICGNCHQPVPGRFCAACGQEDRTYLLSLRELLLDFFGDLINFDSRFFKTTIPLLFRPGHLTAEYIRGRRQAYFPPVRLYIFISIIFFFVAAMLTDATVEEMDANDAFMVNKEKVPATAEERAERIRDKLEEQRARLQEAGLLEAAETYLPDEKELIARTEKELAQGEQGDDTAAEGAESTKKARLTDDANISVNALGIPEIDQRIERGVEAVRANPGAFIKSLVDDLPVMMFIFLPIIALVLKLLYFLTGRYYVEHLIFTLHFHAAVFVLMLLYIVNGELKEGYEFWNRIAGWISVAIWIYVPVYLFRSMRVVYGQGRLFTTVKFLLLYFAYTLAAALTLSATVMIGLWRQG